MTFEEAKEMLKQIRGLKNKARDIMADINECRQNIDALTLHSALSGTMRVQGGEADSVVEQIVERLEERTHKFETLLERIFKQEDELTAALETLTETERDVIIGYYMRDKSHKRLAREMNYSVRSVNYIKERAIGKISQKL